MKPANFPRQKKLRQINASLRATGGYKSGSDPLYSKNQRDLEQVRTIRSKKDRRIQPW